MHTQFTSKFHLLIISNLIFYTKFNLKSVTVEYSLSCRIPIIFTRKYSNRGESCFTL